MTVYEGLLQKAADEGLTVHERCDFGNDSVSEEDYLLGLCYKNHILLAQELETQAEKTCVLAEEYAHAVKTVGDILNQSDIDNRKQERKARILSYDELFGIEGIVKALKEGCCNAYEMAEYLGITEKVLMEALQCYETKYGQRIETDEYELYFDPCLMLFTKEMISPDREEEENQE